MKHLLDISGGKVLLTAAQLEIIAEVVAGAELLQNKYIGSKGGNASSYQPYVEAVPLHDWFKANMVTEDYIDSIKLAWKLQQEQA